MNKKKSAERPIRIEQYMPYLLNRVAMRMIKGSKPRFADLKLTVPTWRILLTLSEHKACRFGELVKLTTIEPATLSRLTDQLHRRGLVRRKTAPGDARSMVISLSPAGADLYGRSVPFALDVQARLLDGVSEADVRVVRRALVRMYENLEQHGDKS